MTSKTRAHFTKDGKIGIIVYDEAHRAVATRRQKELSKLRGVAGRGKTIPILGLTATPFRRTEDGTRRLQAYFGDKPIFQQSFSELIRTGFLARPNFHRYQLTQLGQFELDDAELAEIKRMRDFTPRVLQRLARQPKRNESIVSLWNQRRQFYGKTLAFACDIEHADRLAKCFREYGVEAVSLHSHLSLDDRATRLQRFREQRGPVVLVNVEILTEGANIPDIRTVLMARPTLSPVLYTQMIGRAARGPKTVPGKHDFYVVDCVDNLGIHGPILAGRQVALDLAIQPIAITAHKGIIRQQSEHTQMDSDALREQVQWLLEQGIEVREYSLWGFLCWHEADTSLSLPVFNETSSAVFSAVDQLLEALSGNSPWATIEGLGAELHGDLAVSEARWHEMVIAVRTSGQAPILEQASLDSQLLCTIVAEEVHVVRDSESHATVLDIFKTSEADAFIDMAMAVARADGTVHSEEIKVTRLALESMGFVREDFDGRIDVASHSEADVGEAAQLLVLKTTPGQRISILDHLCRVAIADGKFLPEEHILLNKAGVLLELPANQIREAIQRASDAAGAPVPLSDGFVSCSGCHQAVPPQSLFCGFCGQRTRATKDNWGVVDAEGRTTTDSAS